MSDGVEIQRIMKGRRPPFFYIVLLLGGLILAFEVIAVVWIMRFGGLERDLGFEISRDSEGRYIETVDPAGLAAGKLKAGDRPIAINGDTRVQRGPLLWGTLWLKVSTIPLDGTYTIRVRRGSSQIDFPLQTKLKQARGRSTLMIVPVAVSLVCVFCGLLIGVLRPDQRITQLVTLACLGGGGLGLDGAAIFPLGEFLRGWQLLLYFASMGCWFPAIPTAFDFYHRFPPGIIPSKFWGRFRYPFYIFGFVLFGFLCLIGYLAAYPDLGMQVYYDHYRSINFFWSALALYILLMQAGNLGVLIRNYRTAREPDQRRRVKWVFFGAIGATAPGALFFSVFVLQLLLGINFLSPERMFLLSGSFVILVPISLTYSVLKHRVMDVQVVIRRGLQYLLARNVLRVILLLPVAGIVWNILANPNRTLKDIALNNSIYFYLFVAASFGLIFQGRLREWIDRKFFREAYNREQILLGLIEEVKKLDSISEISRLISKELESALHPRAVYFFFREQEKAGFALGYSSGGGSQNLRIEEGSAILQILEKEEAALPLPLSGKHELPATDSEWLSALGISLMVPMRSSDQHLAGVVLLGEKRSEEPYTSGDCKLLSALASQIATVHETSALKARIGKEQQVRRDVLARIDEQSMNLLQECPVCHSCYDRSVQICSNDGNALELSLPVERTIDGKYRLDRLIGKGGMGAVYEAKDLRLDRKVAVKVMLGGMFGDQTALRRFEREARASARLNHPNIIAVYDYGAIGSSGAFLVMELAQGESLRAHLKRGVGLDPVIAADWFDQLFEGIQVAHEACIVHRDLKPENVLVIEKEKSGALIKVLDFGLAKLKLPDISNPDSLTLPGTVMGTLHYMSPEQLSGQEIDERTDIYALGIMVAEALTGQRPFDGRTTTELVTSILQKQYHLEGLSKEEIVLDELLQKCLAKSRSDRFGSVTQMRRELVPTIRAFPWRPGGTTPVEVKDKESQPTEAFGSEIETREK